MSDRFSRWAIAGSLAWLVIAVGLILGTHGGSVLQAQAQTVEVPAEVEAAGSWSALPAASGDLDLSTKDFQRC